MGFWSSFITKNSEKQILLDKLRKAELKLYALPKTTNTPNYYDDTSAYIQPLIWNEDMILEYCNRSAILTSIFGVLLKECTKDNWIIKPMFQYKCVNKKCEKEYNHQPENELCECGSPLRKPDIKHKNILENFIDDPNPHYDFYEIIRSCLLWELKLDRYYVNVSYTYQQGDYKKLSKTPTGLFVENPRYIRIRDAPQEKFCPLCYTPDKIYKNGETACLDCGTELWDTYYIKLENPNSENIVARYKKEEIIEGHYNRQLPDLYGTPKLISAIQQLQALIGLDNLNSDIFVKRKLNKIYTFSGATQEQIDEIRDNVENNIREGFGLRKFLYDVYLGISGNSEIKVFDALPDAEKLQSLEWYKFYREVLASVFEVPPVFSGVVESGKAGNNPNIQDVVMGSTKRGLIRTIEEPFNKRIMEGFGVTDYYIAFPDFTIKDELRDAQIQKIRAETANIFLTSGFLVQYSNGELIVSEEPLSSQKQIQPEVQYIDVEEVIDDPVKYEKFTKLIKKKICC